MSTRRTLLRQIRAGAGFVAVGSLAGCSANDIPGLKLRNQSSANDAGSSTGSGENTSKTHTTTRNSVSVGHSGKARGNVLVKRLVGGSDGSTTIVESSADELKVADQSYKSRFHRGNITIDDKLAKTFKSKYGSFSYEAVVELTTNDPVHSDLGKGDKATFALNQAAFNELNIGESILFVVAGTKKPTIKKIIV